MNADRTSSESNIPSGSIAAALVAAAIGCFAVSALALLADAYASLGHLMTFYAPTGPLSGVTTTAIGIWLGSWAVLSWSWQRRSIPLGKISALALLLLGLGFLLSFPPLGEFLQGR